MSLDSERAQWCHRSAGHGQWPHWRDWRTNCVRRSYNIHCRLFIYLSVFL